MVVLITLIRIISVTILLSNPGPKGVTGSCIASSAKTTSNMMIIDHYYLYYEYEGARKRIPVEYLICSE